MECKLVRALGIPAKNIGRENGCGSSPLHSSIYKEQRMKPEEEKELLASLIQISDSFTNFCEMVRRKVEQDSQEPVKEEEEEKEESKLDKACKILNACLFCGCHGFYVPEDTTRKHLIVNWTGGWDSTALLILLAHNFGTVEKPIIAHYTKCKNINQLQQESELNSIKKFKEKFLEWGLNIQYSESEVTLGCEISGIKYDNGIGQIPVNILSPVFYHFYEDTTVFYGYVYKDDVWAKWHNLKEAVKHCGLALGNPSAHVSAPFVNTTKKEIKTFLQELGILDDCWYCEAPTEVGVPCGTCLSCKGVKGLL